MQRKKKSSLKAIGYLDKIPRDADINEYEKINIKNKAGKTNTLYRLRKESHAIDETTNFNKSWEIFNNHLS